MSHDVQTLAGRCHVFQPIVYWYLNGILHGCHEFRPIVYMYHECPSIVFSYHEFKPIVCMCHKSKPIVYMYRGFQPIVELYLNLIFHAYPEFQPIEDLYLSGICHIYHDFELIVGMYHKYVRRHDIVTRTTDSGAQNMEFTCSTLLSRWSEVILEPKIWIFHVVHFCLGGLSLFWSSKYEYFM